LTDFQVAKDGPRYHIFLKGVQKTTYTVIPSKMEREARRTYLKMLGIFQLERLGKFPGEPGYQTLRHTTEGGGEATEERQYDLLLESVPSVSNKKRNEKLGRKLSRARQRKKKKNQEVFHAYVGGPSTQQETDQRSWRHGTKMARSFL